MLDGWHRAGRGRRWRVGLAISLMLVPVLWGRASATQESAREGPVRNLILFVGDGLGTAQRTLAYDYLRVQPFMDRMNVIGLVTTEPYCPDPDKMEITDSSASATALATGVKTYNGAIAVRPDKRPVRTILEAAREAGMATGLVVTCQVNHATPAAFAAHDEDRDHLDAIAADYLATRPEVILGGGTAYFLPAGQGGQRQDGRDLLEEFRQAGYTVITRPEDLAPVARLPVIGLFADKALRPEIDRDPAREPSLKEMTRRALDLLSQDEDGFFLLVEGSQIDWASHAHDASWMIHDILAFDEAVGAAFDFQSREPSTLILVTGDHETGGLAIGRDMRFAPGALHEITASYARIARLIEEDRGSAAAIMKRFAGIQDLDEKELVSLAGAEDVLPEVTRFLNDRLGLLWAGADHSGEMIPLTAQGPGACLFAGCYDNTDVARKMAATLGIRLGEQ